MSFGGRKPERVKVKGDYVWFWFDTGSMGVNQCYGRVIKAGPKTFTVRWGSGIQNRIQQDDATVMLVDPATPQYEGEYAEAVKSCSEK